MKKWLFLLSSLLLFTSLLVPAACSSSKYLVAYPNMDITTSTTQPVVVVPTSTSPTPVPVTTTLTTKTTIPLLTVPTPPASTTTTPVTTTTTTTPPTTTTTTPPTTTTTTIPPTTTTTTPPTTTTTTPPTTTTTTPPTTIYRTKVGGNIALNTTWTKANGPYQITATVVIMGGTTLTIEPGVAINAPPSGDMFELEGTIIAHGTSQDPITFTGNVSSDIFGPYHTAYQGKGDFDCCVFQNATSLWNRWGQITLKHSQVLNIKSGGSGIQTLGAEGDGASVILASPPGPCDIEYNKFINSGGIYAHSASYVTTIKYNLFQGLTTPLCNGGGVMNVNNNSFVNIQGVILWLVPSTSLSMDATNNYWSTYTTSVIDSKIHDSNDDAKISSTVIYNPVLMAPNPNTPTP